MMKDKIIKLLREAVLTEKTVDVNNDVDFLYDKYFKADIDKIQETGVIERGMFRRAQTNTFTLSDDASKEANDKGGICRIDINKGDNFYNPHNSTISLSINFAAVKYVLEEGGDLHKAKKYLTPRMAKSLVQEFTEEKIKGSIHHELAHWVDDITHNRHIKKKTMQKRDDLINVHHLERHAQIHNIIQLKRKHGDIWDLMSFDELIKLSPALNTIYHDLPEDVRKKWILKLKRRMYREGLLGDNMR